MGERVGEGLAKEEVAGVLVGRIRWVLLGAWGANDFLAACDDFEVILCAPETLCELAEVGLDFSCALVAVGGAEGGQRQADGALDVRFGVFEVDGGDVVCEVFAVGLICSCTWRGGKSVPG